MGYKRISDVYTDFEFVGCDVQLEKGALLLDETTGNVIAQLKFCNYSEHILESLYISIEQYDDTYVLLDEGRQVEFAYLDLNLGKNASFGDNKAIVMNNKKTRRIKVHISKYKLDSKIVYIEKEEIVQYGRYLVDLTELPVDKIQYLENEIPDIKTEYCKEYYPLDLEKNWFCSCGKFNIDNDKCIKCGLDRQIQFEVITDENINNAYEKHLDELIESRNIAKKKKQKYLINTVAVITAILCVITIAVSLILFVIPKSKISKAEKIDEKQYQEALDIYKDLETFYGKLDNFAIFSNKENDMKYKQAELLLNIRKYDDAKKIFEDIKDYKDSNDKIEEVNYHIKHTEQEKVTLNMGCSLSSDYIYTLARTVSKKVEATISIDYSYDVPNYDEVRVEFSIPDWQGLAWGGWKDTRFRYVGKYSDIKDGTITGHGKLYENINAYISGNEVKTTNKYNIVYSGGFKNGKFDGSGIIYYENYLNTKCITASFEDGNVKGDYIRYYSNGEKNDSGTVYSDGKVVSSKFGDEDYSSKTINALLFVNWE